MSTSLAGLRALQLKVTSASAVILAALWDYRLRAALGWILTCQKFKLLQNVDLVYTEGFFWKNLGVKMLHKFDISRQLASGCLFLVKILFVQHEIHLSSHNNSKSQFLFCSGRWALLTGLSFIICPCGMPLCPKAAISWPTRVFKYTHTHTHTPQLSSFHLTVKMFFLLCQYTAIGCKCLCLNIEVELRATKLKRWLTLKLMTFLSLIRVFMCRKFIRHDFTTAIVSAVQHSAQGRKRGLRDENKLAGAEHTINAPTTLIFLTSPWQ